MDFDVLDRELLPCRFQFLNADDLPRRLLKPASRDFQTAVHTDDFYRWRASRVVSFQFALSLKRRQSVVRGVEDCCQKFDARPSYQMCLLDEELDCEVDGLVELDFSFGGAGLDGRGIDHGYALSEVEFATDGLGAQLAFRCPHWEIGKIGSFTISVVSD